MSGITIYKASAGSGKTFKLTQQYLFMIISNPHQYKNILAVTFTNKATAEMKNRIVNELNNLSEGKPTPHANTLRKFLNLNDHQLKQNARQALGLILHDYSRFSVSTIDHFFQRVIRNFARETGLQSGYNLELDQTEILNYAVDELLLAAAENEQLKKWLVDFARSRIQDGKSWDFRNEIMFLANELTTEQVKSLNLEHFEATRDKKTMALYLNSLNKIANRFEKQLQSYGEQAVEIIEKADLSIGDFKYRGNAANYFYYLKQLRKDKLEPGANVRKALEDTDNWPKPKIDENKKQLIIRLAQDHLMDILNEAVSFYENHFIQYNTALEVKKNIFILGILADIRMRIDNHCKEKNIFLISDASELLRKIIGNNDAPFVYEKTGSQYKHFMLDEFQDTSRFQWDNFKPLIQNSLAENGYNMLVGDIKQSIYRWRNSDWKILSDEVLEDFSSNSTNIKLLDANYRSAENMIAYNNTVFASAPHILQNQFNEEFKVLNEENPWQQKLTTAYADVQQEMPYAKPGGYVRGEFIKHLNGKRDEAREHIAKKVIQDIEFLQDQGYTLSDMAILVRRNTEGQEIANAILEYKNSKKTSSRYQYDVVSSDSLYISNSESVQFLLALFKYFIQPDDLINRAFIKELYQRTILQKDFDEEQIHRLFATTKDDDSFSDWMPKNFIDKVNELRKMPLYELTERLIKLFDITELKQEIPYIQAFQNIILDYSRRYPSDISTFLDWWTINGKSKKLQLPEDYEAIKIVTIHKAKGLEFKAVIIPFAYWELDNPSSGVAKNFLWCEPGDSELQGLKAVPVTYSSHLISTQFAKQYYDELFHNYVDNLNLLYVAFTRAEEVLLFYVPIQENKKGILNYIDKNKGVTHVGELLHYMIENPYPIHKETDKPIIENLNKYWKSENWTIEWGKPGRLTEKRPLDEEHILLKEFPAYMNKPPIQFKYSHNEFFKDSPDLMGRIDYGKIMHQIFEHIVVEEDINKALDYTYMEGKIDSQERLELEKQIKTLFKDETVKDWFSGNWKVFTERQLLLPNGKVYRPDRVMLNNDTTLVVDYKFGEKNKQHKNQVERYLEQIAQMGYKNPKGYIWYVQQNDIVTVNE
jgi:ATP-dependent exoDNAse (exonuclease V) beta subunit